MHSPFLELFPAAAAEVAPLRVGLTPVFLDNQTALVNEWRVYLERRLGRPVTFVQRARYREIIDLLRANKLDFAWICGYPYVNNRDVLTLLAVPVYWGFAGCKIHRVVATRKVSAISTRRQNRPQAGDVSRSPGHDGTDVFSGKTRTSAGARGGGL